MGFYINVGCEPKIMFLNKFNTIINVITSAHDSTSFFLSNGHFFSDASKAVVELCSLEEWKEWDVEFGLRNEALLIEIKSKIGLMRIALLNELNCSDSPFLALRKLAVSEIEKDLHDNVPNNFYGYATITLTEWIPQTTDSRPEMNSEFCYHKRYGNSMPAISYRVKGGIYWKRS